jgi:hypothetical protein
VREPDRLVVVTPALLASLCALLAGGCPRPLPPPPPGFHFAARLAPEAPEADARDPPPTDGILPAAVPPGVLVVDLGLVGIAGGQSGDILVETRALGAFQVLVYGHPGATVILESALDPDGAAVIDETEPAGLSAQRLAFARGFPGPVFSVNRVLPSAGSGAFLVPNTPSVPAADGTWILRVGHYDVDLDARPATRAPIDRPVRVVLLGRGADTGEGQVDVNVHLAGAADESFAAGALDVVREAWGPIGVSLASVRTRALDPAFATVVLEERRCEGGGLDALLAEARGSAPGIDVFFVDGFVCIGAGGVDLGAAIGGLSAGIPGPAWVHGSPHAGVVVATSSGTRDARAAGAVLAHELGHFLGLYHTKEGSGGTDPIHDEIEDSPEGDDADENLMYFAVNGVLSLSEGQGQVLRTSPFVVPLTTD